MRVAQEPQTSNPSPEYHPVIDDTSSQQYTDRLHHHESARWKRWLDVQRPYRWNLRRLGLGFTLDLGCGLGRNLAHLHRGGVGIDHNPSSVALCRKRGLRAYTPDEFATSPDARERSYDSLLAAHLIEHLQPDEAVRLLGNYLRFIREGGKVVIITPQRRGYASDSTHVSYVDFDGVDAIASALNLEVERRYSFPFPWSAVGRLFTYNEHVVVARLTSPLQRITGDPEATA